MFSVIIPNYNRADKISRAIESVLCQTHEDFELIVVDDCSTDNSIEEISKFKDGRLKIFKMPKNSGPSVARNFGIIKSTGNLISFLDSDDMYEDDFLETAYYLMIESPARVGFMWTGRRLHFRNHTKEEVWVPERFKTPYVTFLNDLRIGTGAGITLKREVFESCGYFNENLSAAEDTDFFLRVSRRFDYTFSEKILINIFKDSSAVDRVSINYRNIALAYNLFINDHIAEILKHNDLRIKFFYKLMWLNYHIPDKKTSRKYYRLIPLNNLSLAFKVVGLLILYEVLPLNIAKKVHFRFAINV